MDILVEFKHVLFKLISLIILMPILGYGILLSIESLEEAWKSGNRKKKWHGTGNQNDFLKFLCK